MRDIFAKHKSDLFTIFNLGLSVFVGFALGSYNPKDPSFNSLGGVLKATNYCGIAGSFTADLLFQLFGLLAWLVPILLILSGIIRLFEKQKNSFTTGSYILMFFILSSLGALLSSYWPDVQYYEKNISIGGVIGYSTLKGLTLVFNSFGAQIVLWSMLVIEVVIFFEKKLKDIFMIPTRATLGGFQQIKRLFFKEKSKELVKTKEPEKSIDSKREKIKFELPFLKKQNVISSFEKTSPELSGFQSQKFVFEEKESSEKVTTIKTNTNKKLNWTKKVENWIMPKLDLLENPPDSRLKIDKIEIQRKAEMLKEKLLHFSIEGEITEAKPGPLVTMYEFKPNADVKISKISELEDDLSLALSSESVRVVGHIPGRDVVGIETSNVKRETVFYKELISENTFWKDEFTLPLALGRNVEGDPRIVDLRKMPHLLIAGTTGSGKSVFVASIIAGLIFKHSPKTLRMVLIDPKMVDLAHFATIPHLILPHVTESKKAVSALKWSVREMEKRYRSLSQFGASKIEAYNQKVEELSAEEIKQHEEDSDNRYYFKPLPYIVIVIDELADLMVSEKQNVEQPIQRLTQMARACGMHLIIATQSPRKDVVTGLIKTNIPGRVALKVSSKMDSRIILDDSGAERLLPNGDMLFLAPGVNKPTRHHGPYLSDKEIQRLVQFWAGQGEPEYDTLGIKILEGFSGDAGASGSGESMDDEYDDRYDEILSWAAEQKEVSASLIQRRFRLGYPRAARIIELFEKEGVVGPANGSKPRQVLLNPMQA
ncbi:MAG TPA: DNA translocase FtsK 4TM domain-containing protein [Pseudobdellovibrionaceae bacterium]|nr:DNA translocase FtsK 4TM domain-containing protein [Pseudobdellovibrionaceae bacterium]